ncbi:guanylate kinase [Flavobacteriales bacterium]|jgi:guanylate kinase|nr:guanylate kinase [Flavobacteriales bacterium]MDC3337074.1 guanylate kinase [Flavobacteriales bacterium]
MKQGKAVIFSAPSGAGKTTIVRHLLSLDFGLEFSVSATTRLLRGNETNGKDYHFLSVSDFKNKITTDDFIEWEEVYPDHFYGTLKSEINRVWSNGKHLIFDVDVDGGINLKKHFKEAALSIFVQPPSLNVLEERLRLRQTESETNIRQRVAKADTELTMAKHYDHILTNHILQDALKEAELVVGDFLNA